MVDVPPKSPELTAFEEAIAENARVYVRYGTNLDPNGSVPLTAQQKEYYENEVKERIESWGRDLARLQETMLEERKTSGDIKGEPTEAQKKEIETKALEQLAKEAKESTEKYADYRETWAYFPGESSRMLTAQGMFGHDLLVTTKFDEVLPEELKGAEKVTFRFKEDGKKLEDSGNVSLYVKNGEIVGYWDEANSRFAEQKPPIALREGLQAFFEEHPEIRTTNVAKATKFFTGENDKELVGKDVVSPYVTVSTTLPANLPPEAQGATQVEFTVARDENAPEQGYRRYVYAYVKNGEVIGFSNNKEGANFTLENPPIPANNGLGTILERHPEYAGLPAHSYKGSPNQAAFDAALQENIRSQFAFHRDIDIKERPVAGLSDDDKESFEYWNKTTRKEWVAELEKNAAAILKDKTEGKLPTEEQRKAAYDEALAATTDKMNRKTKDYENYRWTSQLFADDKIGEYINDGKINSFAQINPNPDHVPEEHKGAKSIKVAFGKDGKKNSESHAWVHVYVKDDKIIGYRADGSDTFVAEKPPTAMKGGLTALFDKHPELHTTPGREAPPEPEKPKPVELPNPKPQAPLGGPGVMAVAEAAGAGVGAGVVQMNVVNNLKQLNDTFHVGQPMRYNNNQVALVKKAPGKYQHELDENFKWDHLAVAAEGKEIKKYSTATLRHPSTQEHLARIESGLGTYLAQKTTTEDTGKWAANLRTYADTLERAGHKAWKETVEATIAAREQELGLQPSNPAFTKAAEEKAAKTTEALKKLDEYATKREALLTGAGIPFDKEEFVKKCLEKAQKENGGRGLTTEQINAAVKLLDKRLEEINQGIIADKDKDGKDVTVTIKDKEVTEVKVAGAAVGMKPKDLEAAKAIFANLSGNILGFSNADGTAPVAPKPGAGAALPKPNGPGIGGP